VLENEWDISWHSVNNSFVARV